MFMGKMQLSEFVFAVNNLVWVEIFHSDFAHF